MVTSSQILSTLHMIDREKLDVRTITMGISLLECAPGPVDGLYAYRTTRIACAKKCTITSPAPHRTWCA